MFLNPNICYLKILDVFHVKFFVHFNLIAILAVMLFKLMASMIKVLNSLKLQKDTVSPDFNGHYCNHAICMSEMTS